MAKVAIVVTVVLADIYAVSTPPMLAISYVAVHCTKGGVGCMFPEVPLPVRNPGLNITHGSWRLVSPHLKRHFDWLSRFAGLTDVTHKQTDHATLSVVTARI